jgi:hypothetical protein
MMESERRKTAAAKTSQHPISQFELSSSSVKAHWTLEPGFVENVIPSPHAQTHSHTHGFTVTHELCDATG